VAQGSRVIALATTLKEQSNKTALADNFAERAKCKLV
jgi:hypothetical protein